MARKRSVKFIGVVPAKQAVTLNDTDDEEPINKRRRTSNKLIPERSPAERSPAERSPDPCLVQEDTVASTSLKPTLEQQQQLLVADPSNICIAIFLHNSQKKALNEHDKPASLHQDLLSNATKPLFILDVRTDLRQIIGIQLVFNYTLQDTDTLYLSRQQLNALPNATKLLIALEKIISFNPSAFIKPFYATKYIINFLQQFLPSLFKGPF